MRRLTRRAVGYGLAGLMVLGGGLLRAQDDEAGSFAGGQMVRGAVTVVATDRLTIKTERGEVYQVTTTTNTRVMKDRQPMKLAEIKPGDSVGAMGVLDPPTKTVHAAFVVVVDAEQVRKAKEGLGKVYIAGRVTAMEELKLTILRPDGVSQVIAVDEGTSFRRGGRGLQSLASGSEVVTVPEGAPSGESVTLGDVKVGDSVVGKGGMKGGVFVPVELSMMDRAMRQRRRNGGGGSAGGSAGEAGPNR